VQGTGSFKRAISSGARARRRGCGRRGAHARTAQRADHYRVGGWLGLVL